jgi:hypothetical protein
MMVQLGVAHSCSGTRESTKKKKKKKKNGGKMKEISLHRYC